MRSALTILGLLTAGRLTAQTLEVHSEFLRVNPQGEILGVDTDPKPREILSPAVVRNGYASFHIVVRSSHPTSFFLFASANPATAVRTIIYKEQFVKRGDDWIPDTLEALQPPSFGIIPESPSDIAGQTACVYLLDVWVPPETPSSRVRLEAQLKVGSWVIYPMEVRVLNALAPSPTGVKQELPVPELRADQSAMAPLVAYMDGKAGPRIKAVESLIPKTVRDVIRRNAEQDMALARTVDAKTLIPALKQKFESSTAGGEWYLGVRDLIYRLASRTPPP